MGDGTKVTRIGIVGAGAWGTALAMVARRAGGAVTLWAREAEVAEAIARDRINPVYLAGVPLDPEIRATTDLSLTVDADLVLLVTPAQHLREICERMAAHWPDGVPALICAKGIEQGSGALMTEVAAAALPQARLAVLSGPTFAAEVARDLPTAVTLACGEPELGEWLAAALANPRFRIYQSADLIGAEIGGAVKNVLAIACGIVRGRGLGDNARAALITRGLAEIVRLAISKGARAETLTGLCGLGDLTLTCAAQQSRNFSLGVALGRGDRLENILSARRSVAEGVFSASSVVELARRLEVEMPISTAVDAILNHGAEIDAEIAGLLARPLRTEAPLSASATG